MSAQHEARKKYLEAKPTLSKAEKEELKQIKEYLGEATPEPEPEPESEPEEKASKKSK